MLSKMRLVRLPCLFGHTCIQLTPILALVNCSACVRLPLHWRQIMIEKWEGHCYDGCMYNASKGKLCYSSCDVEGDMLKTIASVKALNPSVLGIMYINTLMAFPFYALSGKFESNDALLIDMYTNKPVELTNDEGMQHVYVYDWGSAKGRQLFLDFIKRLLDSGQADGLFSDKWSYRCSQVNASTWKICNNRCGYVTPAQAAAYNAGAEEVREQISKLLAVNSTEPDTFHGFLYADGLSNTAKCPKAAYGAHNPRRCPVVPCLLKRFGRLPTKRTDG